jgi:hypothetical protein
MRPPVAPRRPSFGTGGGTGLRPCGFPPAPAVSARTSPAVTVRAPARPGHAPPLLHGKCSATRSSRRATWPTAAPLTATGGAPGVPPFAALFPPAGVAASPPLGPTCRLPDISLAGALGVLCVAGAAVAFRPRGSKPQAGSAIGRRKIGRGSWALSPRAIRTRQRWIRATRPMPPWASPLSGLRSSARGPLRCAYAARTVTARGLAEVLSDVNRRREALRFGAAPSALVPFGHRFSSVHPRPFSDTQARRLALPAFAAGEAPCMRFRTVCLCSRRLRRTVLMCYAPDAKAASTHPARCSADLNHCTIQPSNDPLDFQRKIRRGA